MTLSVWIHIINNAQNIREERSNFVWVPLPEWSCSGSVPWIAMPGKYAQGAAPVSSPVPCDWHTRNRESWSRDPRQENLYYASN